MYMKWNYVAYLILLLFISTHKQHIIIFPPFFKTLRYASGATIQVLLFGVLAISLKDILPPHTPCVRLFVLVGVNQHISPSSSSHSVPTSSLLQCFCWVVLPPLRHLLEWSMSWQVSWFPGASSCTLPLEVLRLHSWLLTFTLWSSSRCLLPWSLLFTSR